MTHMQLHRCRGAPPIEFDTYDVKDKTDAYVSIYFPTTKNRRTASTIYNYVKM
ncbi:MAG TPA: hypothetical protein PLI57_11205 [Spirochaetota bacterium]|nr:hypothetical protein [Spirochaetota bacterium]